MIQIKTNIDHNIDDNLRKELLSKVSVLISYLGEDYINQLNQLNDKYDIPNRKTVSNVELSI